MALVKPKFLALDTPEFLIEYDITSLLFLAISNVSFTLEEHSESCDVSAVYKIFDILQMLEKQAVENVFNEYSLKVSPDDQK